MWIELSDLFWLAMTALACLTWWHNLKLREHATLKVQRYCEQHDVQLLDQNIALKSIKPIRSAKSGTLVMARRYQFYFTSTGDERYPGTVDMVGRDITLIELAAHKLS
ncbi:DUF3301 domain-containing protein [Marinobacterium sediminicola]|uniref:DUF3301 domain-containing protein n=1 Tax=Marinobacterium sediminicola TaxID=518898 RepID=A0ABY1RVT5_9GAMM|nr:DUF3301 domain-containing protein [Marinobacterium sediminicola]ULG70545.1 DUF3301 domain-containing protein [Marinobacterium sediminicola]SMR69043.1 Protein of unknown function [Marinobacterium sediminicola]